MSDLADKIKRGRVPFKFTGMSIGSSSFAPPFNKAKRAPIFGLVDVETGTNQEMLEQKDLMMDLK